MAERLISPGVFTEENDLSFLPQGIAEIGAAFVGPFQKGPAFRPVIVQSNTDLQAQFGDVTTDYYTPYAAQIYLRTAARATVVRVLGLGGYDSAVNQSLRLSISGSGTVRTVALIHPSRAGVTLNSGSVSGTPTQFTLTLSGSNGLKTFTSLSLSVSSPNYFAKVLGNNPAAKYDGYVYADFPNAALFVSGALAGSGSLSLSVATGDLNFSGSTWGGYSNATTPMIRSQLLGGTHYNLFQFRTLSDGTAANNDVKISITDIAPPSIAGNYGTFTVLVRDFADTDSKQSVLEQFTGLTLDPTDPNYIANRIGTAHTVIDANGDVYLDGDYPNNSKYIFAVMADASVGASTDALPYGFAALSAPVNRSDVPAPDYITTRYFTPAGAVTPVNNDKLFYGIDLSTATTQAYLKSLPSGSVFQVGVCWSGSAILPAGGADPGFDLLTSIASADALDLTPTTAVNLRKFTVPFQDGWDGQNPAVVRNTGAAITSTNTMGFDLSDSSRDGAKAYNQAIQTLANPENTDINLLITPGVIYSQHIYVVTQGINMVEAREDCFYVLDGDTLGSTVASICNSVAPLDTSYAATYHPWVKIRDTSDGKAVWVPPSVVIPGVYAFNDKVSAEFFAPAGLNRGGIGDAIQVRSRVNQADRDTLYSNHVNPIVSFPGQGVTVWGQKTLQDLASALDRINVRRLLILVKKYIASSSRYLVFEQNSDSTRNRFLAIVNPYLANIQERQGLYAFKVVMDDTNNTADLIDRNILVGTLYLQPTKSVEFIQLTFNVLPTGATFPQ